MIRIAGAVDVAPPPGVMFDAVADERNRYDPRIRHAELLTDGPIGVGTRFRSVAGSARRPVEMIVEITDYQRPRRLASATHTALMDIDSTLVFVPTLSGTRMRWSSQLRPRGIFKLLTPILPLAGRRQTRRVWGALTAHLERSPATATATATRGDNDVTAPTGSLPNAIDLYWLPLGAGDHVVKRFGRMY